MNEKDGKRTMHKGHGHPFGHAFRGILETCRRERNFRIHLAIGAATVALGLWLGLSSAEWRWIVACSALVLVSELLNTALEALVDLASPDYHQLAKRAKDAAAAAVLLAAIAAVTIGCTIFIPKLWAVV